MRLYLTLLLFSVPALVAAQSVQESACYLTGQLSTTAIAGGALATCSVTGNPVTCAVAGRMLICAGDPACDGVVATLTEAGCNYSVTKSYEVINFTIKTTIENADKLRHTYDQLNTVEGIIWLERYLSQ